MAIILGSQSAVSGAYDVDNSCRFDGTSAYMSRTLGTPTSTSKFTISVWVKKGAKGTNWETIFHAFTNTTNFVNLSFNGDDQLAWHVLDSNSEVSKLIGTPIHRDSSAWMHVCFAWDSTQGTAANRTKAYINGTQQTVFGTQTNSAEDADYDMNTAVEHIIGAEKGNTAGSIGNWFNGYMAEFCFIDGLALAPTSFGEFDEDSPTIWKPIDVSGLTFGNNGLYLDFEDSDNLGDDESGNTLDFAETNLAATDQMTDTPTNNYATLNPLMVPAANQPTFSEGNLKSVTNTTSGEYGWGGATTIGVTSGKWYCEALATVSGTSRSGIGVHYDPAEGARDNSYSVNEDYAWGYHSETGVLENDNATVWDGNAYVTDDIIGIYLDLDNHKLYIAKNGTLENSGTGASLTTGKTYFFYQEDLTGGTDHSTFEFNFGAGTSWTVSSGNADANGYGNFEYDPSAGSFDSASKDFYALNTKNLAEFG